jgi:hypothetical protein
VWLSVLGLLILCVFHHPRKGSDQTPNVDATGRVGLNALMDNKLIWRRRLCGTLADKSSRMETRHRYYHSG